MPSYIPGYLKLEELEPEFTRGVIGPGSYGRVFRAYISIANYPAHEVNASSFEMPYAILGRDILNHYHITLDGPNLTLTISG